MKTSSLTKMTLIGILAKLRRLVWSGEEEELVSKAQQPQTQFADFSERLLEQRE